MTTDKPSISELQRSPWGQDSEAVRDAAPVLLEIVAAALVARDAVCDCGTDDSGHYAGCRVLAADNALTDALAKVRP